MKYSGRPEEQVRVYFPYEGSPSSVTEAVQAFQLKRQFAFLVRISQIQLVVPTSYMYGWQLDIGGDSKVFDFAFDLGEFLCRELKLHFLFVETKTRRVRLENDENATTTNSLELYTDSFCDSLGHSGK